MAIATVSRVIESQLWPQGDIRDPLGIWGSRLGVTGDASGGGIKVTHQTAEEDSAAYIYTCYSTTLAKLTGTETQAAIKTRLLTNWPDIDPIAGVQGYASLDINTGGNGSALSSPDSGTRVQVQPNHRFLLLFDPRPQRGSTLDIVEQEFGQNVDGDTYAFEAYGYYWDRSVLNAPGGPRHPGSS